MIDALLRVPLTAKLAGANALLVIAAAVAVFVIRGDGITKSQLVVVMIIVLIGSLLLNLTLVHLALRPLRHIEDAATRVSHGDLDARVSPSPLADRDMQRIGNTLNTLLDRLAAERSRVRELAADVIKAGDLERARIGRELHDSTAQTLAALVLQASSAVQSARDEQSRQQLELIRNHAVEALEEVRALSHTVHPRVLDDLGLVPALETLARRTRSAHEIDVTVQVVGGAPAISSPLSSALYTIAQEAVDNAVRHARATEIWIILGADDHAARFEVRDDGMGFDREEARGRRTDRGLFVMAERAALVDGTLVIDSAPGRGTRILVTAPISSLTPALS